MSRWVLARPGTHTRRTLRAPDGSCQCGEDTGDMVALACASCRELPWSDCDRCGCGTPTEALEWVGSYESPVCRDCAEEFCPECGLDGRCRCDEGDRAYDLWKDEGIRS